jgi:hypothetical protein
MVSIGHELQHAVEVLESSARSTAELYNFFEYSPGVYRVGDRFETREAIEAGLAVGREVAQARRPKGPATPTVRIRTDDPDIAQAIARATEWSDTFRHLVEAIERTDGVVWIRRGRCAGTSACLLVYLEISGPNRLLRINVAPRRSGDRLMESLGHELQHAVEVLGSSARSAADVYFFFHRGADAYRIGERFETHEAVQAEIAVRTELAQARQLPGAARARKP